MARGVGWFGLGWFDWVGFVRRGGMGLKQLLKAEKEREDGRLVHTSALSTLML